MEVSYFTLSLALLSSLITPLLPESPVWLMNQGRHDEALSALLHLRGACHSDQVSQEFQSLQNAQLVPVIFTFNYLYTFFNGFNKVYI